MDFHNSIAPVHLNRMGGTCRMTPRCCAVVEKYFYLEIFSRFLLYEHFGFECYVVKISLYSRFAVM
jgi:hypothetical protein